MSTNGCVNGKEWEGIFFLTQMVIRNKNVNSLPHILGSFLISPTIPYESIHIYICKTGDTAQGVNPSTLLIGRSLELLICIVNISDKI